MLELGKRQILYIHRLAEIGAYVGEEGSPDEAVLLPRRQVPEGACVAGSGWLCFFIGNRKA